MGATVTVRQFSLHCKMPCIDVLSKVRSSRKCSSHSRICRPTARKQNLRRLRKLKRFRRQFLLNHLTSSSWRWFQYSYLCICGVPERLAGHFWGLACECQCKEKPRKASKAASEESEGFKATSVHVFLCFSPPPPPLSRIARAALEAVSGKAGNLALALFHEDEKYYSAAWP